MMNEQNSVATSSSLYDYRKTEKYQKLLTIQKGALVYSRLQNLQKHQKIGVFCGFFWNESCKEKEYRIFWLSGVISPYEAVYIESTFIHIFEW